MGEKDEFLDTVRDFKNKELIDGVYNIKEANPLDSLKATLFSFFETRLSNLQQEETFKTTIKNALLDKIELGEVSFNQLMQLYKEIQMANTKAVDSILDILKPAPAGTVSLLVSSPKVEEEHDDRFNSLNPEERDLLTKLSSFVNRISEEKVVPDE